MNAPKTKAAKTQVMRTFMWTIWLDSPDWTSHRTPEIYTQEKFEWGAILKYSLLASMWLSLSQYYLHLVQMLSFEGQAVSKIVLSTFFSNHKRNPRDIMSATLLGHLWVSLISLRLFLLPLLFCWAIMLERLIFYLELNDLWFDPLVNCLKSNPWFMKFMFVSWCYPNSEIRIKGQLVRSWKCILWHKYIIC